MDQFHHGEIWGDGMGGAAPLSGSYQPGEWIYTGVNSTLYGSATFAGSSDASSIEIQVEWKDAHTGDIQVLDVQAYTDPGDGVVEVDPQTLELRGTRGGLSLTLRLHPWTIYRLQAKHTGGPGDATLLVRGQARPPVPFDRGAVGGGAGPSPTPTQYEADCLATDAVGDAVRITAAKISGRYQVAAMDPTAATDQAVGILASKASSTKGRIQFLGPLAGVYTGLTPGQRYWVGADSQLTDTVGAPAPGGSFLLQLMGVATSSDEVLLNPQIPMRRRG